MNMQFKKQIIGTFLVVLFLLTSVNGHCKKMEYQRDSTVVVEENGVSYVYRTLKEVEFTIPNAEDVIAKCLHAFSREYGNWRYSLVIHDYNPKEIVLLGSYYERPFFPKIERLFYRIGYLTIEGKDIDVYLSYFKGLFNVEVDMYFKETGKSKEFRYELDPILIVDGDVEYHIDITDDALVPKKKIESR